MTPIWEITMHDGTVLRRGDRYMGFETLSPMAPHLAGMIARLTVRVEQDGKEIASRTFTLSPGAQVRYGMTREMQSPGNRIRTVAIYGGSDTDCYWFTPETPTWVPHNGTYEELLAKRVA